MHHDIIEKVKLHKTWEIKHMRKQKQIKHKVGIVVCVFIFAWKVEIVGEHTEKHIHQKT